MSFRRIADDGWAASFRGHATIAPDGFVTAPTPWSACQRAAWKALEGAGRQVTDAVTPLRDESPR